ncbi:chaoptin-like [Centruroides sculpturatus]|uniref:chaoptin-like n=1 Tax=Centruroides sculpturatus TaxID=218467 RepID=UPI000C6ED37E|nr:chaoptin-like [Centruroides sculpturatus]
MLTYIFMLLALSTTCVVGIYHRCPLKENIHPCTCEKINDHVQILCNGLTFKQIKNVFFQAKHINEYDINELFILNSSNLQLSRDLFRELNIYQLKIVNSVIANFDLFGAFIGLQEIFSGIIIKNCTIQNINFTTGNMFHRMRFLIFEQTKITDVITTNMASLFPKSLRKITLSSSTRNGISKIEDKSFSRFPLITILNLSYNQISSIRRSIFPNPAKRLQDLNLAYNNIQFLPDDIFEQMPYLEFLNLSYNKMKILSVSTFLKVWNQLHHANLTGKSFMAPREP